MHHSIPSLPDCCLAEETQTPKSQRLWTALVLVSCFSLAELLVGLSSHSLSLLADSGHMISDSLALGLALLAATWPRAAQQTRPDYRRVEGFAALVNGLGLVAIAVWIAWEAIIRLQSFPGEVLSTPMLVMAGIGLGVNSATAFLLHGGSQLDLNLRGAFLHILADMISSIGVLLAAIAVGLLKWVWADGVIGLFVAGLILLSAVPLMVQSVKSLLEKSSTSLELNPLPVDRHS